MTRSYFTSLDMLVPRKTDVGTFNLGGQTNQDANGAEYKYTQAMDYLRKAAPGVKKTDLDVQGSKDSLVKSGLSPSTVDIYVQKQLAWTSARQKWDAARTLAIGKGCKSMQWILFPDIYPRNKSHTSNGSRPYQPSEGAQVCKFPRTLSSL